MGIFFFVRGSYFENILMGSSIAVLGFYAVKGFYLSTHTNNKRIFRAALFFYAAEYLLWISSYFIVKDSFINPYYLTDTFIMNPALILIAVAQCKEDRACPTT